MELRIQENKIIDYLLNEKHPQGKAKAKFFQERGFSRNNWRLLHDSLARHPETARLVNIDRGGRFGEKRSYDCAIQSPDGRNPCIRTVWMEIGPGQWTLITAYPFL